MHTLHVQLAILIYIFICKYLINHPLLGQAEVTLHKDLLLQPFFYNGICQGGEKKYTCVYRKLISVPTVISAK